MRKWEDICLNHTIEPGPLSEPEGIITQLKFCLFLLLNVAISTEHKIYAANKLYYAPEPKDDNDFAQLYVKLSNFDVRAISHHPKQFIKKCIVGGRQTSQCTKLKEKGGNQVQTYPILIPWRYQGRHTIYSLQRIVGVETGMCYTYNMNGFPFNYGDEVDQHDLDQVHTGGEYSALELILDLGGKVSSIIIISLLENHNSKSNYCSCS